MSEVVTALDVLNNVGGGGRIPPLPPFHPGHVSLQHYTILTVKQSISPLVLLVCYSFHVSSFPA